MKSLLIVTFCVILSVSTTIAVIHGTRSPTAPYFVFVEYFNAQGYGFFGGGALISNRHIVTAATNVHK